MAKVAWPSAVSLGLVAVLAGAWLVPGCGGSTKRTVQPPDGSAGEAGADSMGSGGKSGASHAGNGGSAATAATGEGGAGAEAGEGGVAGEGGESATAGAGAAIGVGGAGAMLPDLDAGSDCVAPTDTTLLSPTVAGLPTAGLALWLRADRGVWYLSGDQHVCAWVDQSGADRVFVPANQSTRPLWEDAGLGGKAAVHVDGVGHHVATGGVLDIPPTSGRTLIAVERLVNTSARCGAIQQGQSGTPGTYLMMEANTYQGVPDHESVFLTNNDYSTPLATSTLPRVHTYTLKTLMPGLDVLPNIDYRVNGTSLSLVRNNAGLGNGTIEDISGMNYTAIGSDCSDFYIAEAIVYSRALTVAESASIEAALEARYGIQP